MIHFLSGLSDGAVFGRDYACIPQNGVLSTDRILLIFWNYIHLDVDNLYNIPDTQFFFASMFLLGRGTIELTKFFSTCDLLLYIAKENLQLWVYFNDQYCKN